MYNIYMILCIDIGGTKTLIAQMTDHGRILKSSRFATAFDQNRFLAILLQEIREKFDYKRARAISVAIPGPVKNDQVLWLGNLPWENFDLVSELKNLFNVPVFMENDANLGGLAEAHHLKGLTVYLTLSTGIGGGVIQDGELEESRRIYEPGHEKYDWQGHLLEWEDIASAKAIVDHFGKLTTEITDKKDWQEIALRISTGLHSVIASIRPDRIILGGPLGFKLKKYQRYLIRELSPSLSPGVAMPKFTPAKLGNESVVYGCHIYAKQRLPGLNK